MNYDIYLIIAFNNLIIIESYIWLPDFLLYYLTTIFLKIGLTVLVGQFHKLCNKVSFQFLIYKFEIIW